MFSLAVGVVVLLCAFRAAGEVRANAWDTRIIAEAECSGPSGDLRALKLTVTSVDVSRYERVLPVRLVLAGQGGGEDRILWQIRDNAIYTEYADWRGAILCGEKPGSVLLILEQKHGSRLGLLAAEPKLDFTSTKTFPTLEDTPEGELPFDKEVRFIASSEVRPPELDFYPWALSAERIGREVYVVIASEGRPGPPLYFRLDRKGRTFTPVNAKALPNPLPLPKGAATGLGKLVASEVLGETRCPSVEGPELSLTLKRRSFLSPPEELQREAGSQLILEIAPRGVAGEVVWGSFLNASPSRAAVMRWSAALKCDPASRRVLIYVLQASPGDFMILRYTVSLASASATTIPAETASLWSFLVNFRIGDLPSHFRETNPTLAASIRGLRPTERDGKEFLELIHEPPEAHEYDLDCDNPAWAIKRVPVAKEKS